MKKKIRVISKLEIKNSFLIKGLQYEGLRKIGNPIDYGLKYFKDGVDQINIIDIVSSLYGRENLYDIVDKMTNNIFIPVCVGGGIKKIDHIKKLLKAGADRVILNSSVLRDNKFLEEVGNTFGFQFLSVSIEAKLINNEFYCMMDHGRENSNIKVDEWVKHLNQKRVGEIIINSVDNDGMENGYNFDLIKLVENKINCPLVASGGAGSLNDFYTAVKNHDLDGVCASSVFHFNRLSVQNVKEHLKSKKINVVE